MTFVDILLFWIIKIIYLKTATKIRRKERGGKGVRKGVRKGGEECREGVREKEGEGRGGRGGG